MMNSNEIFNAQLTEKNDNKKESEKNLHEAFERENFRNMEFKKISQLSCSNELGDFDLAKKMSDLEVVVIDDEEKWKNVYGSNDSKSSHSPKTIILKREIFDNGEISKENLSWLIHEMGHIDFYNSLGSGLDEYMQKYYAAGKYTDSEMEKRAFEEQFTFLKSVGKTKDDCILMIEKYLTQSFDENNKDEKTQEFQQIKKYIENVYSLNGL